jgi:hypothetical protein
MLDSFGKGLQYGRRGAEIRVGDPQRDDVAPGVALPARAPGPAALDRRVEIEKWGQINISLLPQIIDGSPRKC